MRSETVARMRDDIGHALTKLEVLDTVTQRAEDARRDHETRLRTLEAFKWKLAGVCLTLGGLAGSGAASLIALAVHR